MTGQDTDSSPNFSQTSREAGVTADRDHILGMVRERILRFAASRLSRDVAEDLAQEVLLLLTTKYAAVSGVEDLVPLSFRIVRLKMLGYRRKSARRGETTAPSFDDAAEVFPDSGPSGEELTRRREMSDRLQVALRQLNGRCRTIFRMKIDGHGFAEIQRELRAASINTVYTWDARCRKRLLNLMGGSWEE